MDIGLLIGAHTREEELDTVNSWRNECVIFGSDMPEEIWHSKWFKVGWDILKEAEQDSTGNSLVCAAGNVHIYARVEIHKFWDYR